MGILLACMSVYHLQVMCPQMPKDDVGFLELGLLIVVSNHVSTWK